ncbi:unnamed protein product [Urochloa decumbens]|uniref:F-box domain-containing protein n=1 Tax=Urochloa decumbens TaxID=240449 RepID=A0ABC8XZ57_9POAL
MGAAASSPAPALLPDIILEILLRVPPEPIYLLRASLVCKKWRDLIRDPAFLRRFRARHGHAAPLVGFFREDGRFVPTGEPASDRVAAAHFSQPHGGGRRWRVFGSRHGRVLLATTEHERELELLVWDPMTGRRSYFLPPQRAQLEYPAAGGWIRRPLVVAPCVRGALVCDHDVDGDAGGCCHSRPFRVVLLFPGPGSATMSASVYSSQSGAWSVTAANGWWSSISHWEPNTVLVGNEIYWPEGRVEYHRRVSQNEISSPRRVEIPHHSSKLLGYNFNTNWLLHVKGLAISREDPYDCLQVFRDEYGELGLAAVRGSRLHLFEPVADDYEDTAAWSEYKELDLDALLPPPPNPMASSSAPPAKKTPVGFDEDGNTIFLSTWNGVFGLQLQSLKVELVVVKVKLSS